jgi:hypothetical protein
MKKRVWLVILPGHPPFAMISLEGELTHEEARASARVIWPGANVV